MFAPQTLLLIVDLTACICVFIADHITWCQSLNKGCAAQSNVGRKVQPAPHDAQSNSGEHCQEED